MFTWKRRKHTGLYWEGQAEGRRGLGEVGVAILGGGGSLEELRGVSRWVAVRIGLYWFILGYTGVY